MSSLRWTKLIPGTRRRRDRVLNPDDVDTTASERNEEALVRLRARLTASVGAGGAVHHASFAIASARSRESPRRASASVHQRGWANLSPRFNFEIDKEIRIPFDFSQNHRLLQQEAEKIAVFHYSGTSCKPWTPFLDYFYSGDITQKPRSFDVLIQAVKSKFYNADTARDRVVPWAQSQLETSHVGTDPTAVTFIASTVTAWIGELCRALSWECHGGYQSSWWQQAGGATSSFQGVEKHRVDSEVSQEKVREGEVTAGAAWQSAASHGNKISVRKDEAADAQSKAVLEEPVAGRDHVATVHPQRDGHACDEEMEVGSQPPAENVSCRSIGRTAGSVEVDTNDQSSSTFEENQKLSTTRPRQQGKAHNTTDGARTNRVNSESSGGSRTVVKHKKKTKKASRQQRGSGEANDSSGRSKSEDGHRPPTQKRRIRDGGTREQSPLSVAEMRDAATSSGLRSQEQKGDRLSAGPRGSGRSEASVGLRTEVVFEDDFPFFMSSEDPEERRRTLKRLKAVKSDLQDFLEKVEKLDVLLNRQSAAIRAYCITQSYGKYADVLSSMPSGVRRSYFGVGATAPCSLPGFVQGCVGLFRALLELEHESCLARSAEDGSAARQGVLRWFRKTHGEGRYRVLPDTDQGAAQIALFYIRSLVGMSLFASVRKLLARARKWMSSAPEQKSLDQLLLGTDGESELHRLVGFERYDLSLPSLEPPSGDADFYRPDVQAIKNFLRSLDHSRLALVTDWRDGVTGLTALEWTEGLTKKFRDQLQSCTSELARTKLQTVLEAYSAISEQRLLAGVRRADAATSCEPPRRTSHPSPIRRSCKDQVKSGRAGKIDPQEPLRSRKNRAPSSQGNCSGERTRIKNPSKKVRDVEN
ncbi:unnamed protein product [Amoebophrya sp. A120]|nr:unnamed protein product [Amoebophrya sp. A120]|eukprot:GSA120T00011749001.1